MIVKYEKILATGPYKATCRMALHNGAKNAAFAVAI